jgi:predicted RNA-binding protein with PUA-like domain
VAYWLVKTEPGSYSFADLARAGRARWDGVSNPVACRHLRQMVAGDEVLVYHTGGEKAVVGLATVAAAPYPDPADPALPVVDLLAGAPLARPVTLAAIKADPRFGGWELVRLPRLSVLPVPADLWAAVLAMAH